MIPVVGGSFREPPTKENIEQLALPDVFRRGEKSLFCFVLLIGNHTIATLARKLHIFARFIICTLSPPEKFTISPQFR